MKNVKTFYEIQKERQWKTFALLLPVWVCYFLGFSVIYVSAVLVFFSSVATSALGLVSELFQAKVFAVIFGVSLLVALLHWLDAYRNGGAFILKILGARELDPEDTYHQRLRNILDEMKIASGLRTVRGMVLPSLAMNAFALHEKHDQFVIGVTEGILGRLTRSQLEAVIAHEFSHIAKRDIIYLTMLCSLRNIFARMIEMLENLGEDVRKDVLVLVMRVIEALMRLSGALVSRQREYLADATAVEYSRDPLALAEALHIIGRNNRWIGGASGLYAPLFIVSCSTTSLSESEGFIFSLFSTHPPTQKRMDVLLTMAHTSLAQVQEAVARRDAEREGLREKVADEHDKYEQLFARPDQPRWLVQAQSGAWEGPFSLDELLGIPWLMLDSWVSRIGSDKIVKAAADAGIVQAFQRRYGGGHGLGIEYLCPQCGVSLEKVSYEGVPIHVCQSCSGVFARDDQLRRVFARRDRGFSERLCNKAKDWRQKFTYVPARVKSAAASMEGCPLRVCPRCRVPMLRRGYSYQYFVLIDYCNLCSSYWLDKDELEILQFLIEEQQKAQ